MHIAHSKRPLLRGLLYSTAGLALLASVPQGVQAQQAQTAQVDLEQIVVTGSRIVRDGFEAPTPVSVLSVDDLNVMAQPNIADAVNRLPALQGSLGTTNASTNVSSGTGGVNQLNLRALSAVRTLVLLDGKRVVGATLAGFENNGSAVDINGFPGGLVSRVDVVTGGASAVYGSDALAGVVNFVLDREYSGIKGEVSGGISTYGDNEDYKVSLTAGTPFANGRGHFLFFGEHTYTPGVEGSERPYNEVNKAIFANPDWFTDPTQPQYLMAEKIGTVRGTAGGLILGDNLNPANGAFSTSPLRGIQFLEGGTPAPFDFGDFTTGTRTINIGRGGDWQQSRFDRYPSLALEVQRTNFFGRASYDITDNVNVYTEMSWAFTHARNNSVVASFRLGNITVQRENPFIPASVAAQMDANGITSLTMGSWLQGGPEIKADNERTLRRYVGGIEGNFDAFGTDWNWDAYYSRSTTHNGTRSPDNILNAKFNQAVDTIVDPNTGAFVCRDPSGGCVPYNVFGIGVNSQATYDFVSATGYAMTILSQDVLAASVTGSPFATWAGDVSIAMGIEHRIEKVRGIESDDDLNRRFFAGNYRGTDAKYDVTEGFIETVVPLARGETWAESLDLNAAYRGTSYSESGFVSTYKVGATYMPMSDLTIRATRSRDIRAPNLGDLFNEGRLGTGGITDPVLGTSYTVITGDVGNPDVLPEKADTTGVGIVVQPSWIPGFQASVDYYNINIKGALSVLASQDVLDRCFAGVTALCSVITRDPNTNLITLIANGPQNVLSQKTDGVDFEFSYSTPLDNLMSGMEGDITVRGLANYVFHLTTNDPDPLSGSDSIEGAGVNVDGFGLGAGIGLGTPHFRWNTSVTYALDAFAGTLTYRGIGAGVVNNSFVECSASCPVSTLAATTIDDNSVSAVHIFDLALNYKVLDDHATVFFTATNLFNKWPPRVGGTTSAYFSGMDNDNYDRIGRMFRAGVRFTY